ncbi:MAG: CHAT domain-containing protein, partial [bacterium]
GLLSIHSMVLEGGDQLTPGDLSGSIANLGLSNPFVFLNACQIGRNAMSLTDIGGWAASFLKAGASGFVGAHWAVYDNAAYQFAEELYKHLLSGLTVGEAARAARNVIKKLEDPTWLAYTVYAHPSAKVA